MTRVLRSAPQVITAFLAALSVASCSGDREGEFDSSFVAASTSGNPPVLDSSVVLTQISWETMTRDRLAAVTFRVENQSPDPVSVETRDGSLALRLETLRQGDWTISGDVHTDDAGAVMTVLRSRNSYKSDFSKLEAWSSAETRVMLDHGRFLAGELRAVVRFVSAAEPASLRFAPSSAFGWEQP